MYPVNTFDSIDWIYVLIFNTFIQVIRTLMYAVESKFLLPQDVNPVRTHYTISEIKNAVKLIENIDKFYIWRYATFSSGAWFRVMLYICVACPVYTIVPVNCWENIYIKELPIPGRYMAWYHKSRAKFRRCVLIPVLVLHR